MITSRTALGAALWLGLAAAMVLYATCAVYVRIAPPWLDSLGDAVGEVLMREGVRLEAAGALENAEARYVQALAAPFAGDFNRAHTGKLLGALRWRQGQYEAAIPPLRAALEGPVPSLNAYEPLTDSLLQLGRLGEAATVAAAWGAAAETRGDRAAQSAARYQAGRIAQRQGDLDQSIALHEQGLALDPASTSASELGIIYAGLGDRTKAIAYLDHYLTHGGSGDRASYVRQLRARLATELTGVNP
jgi:tetratricopeptide (TPR) repeat protein